MCKGTCYAITQLPSILHSNVLCIISDIACAICVAEVKVGNSFFICTGTDTIHYQVGEYRRILDFILSCPVRFLVSLLAS